jgi:hypothetical protein
MAFRIIAAVVFSVLMIPLMSPKLNAVRERERKTLLVLIGIVGCLMLLLGLLKRWA